MPLTDKAKLNLILVVVGIVAGFLVATPFIYYFLLRDDGTHYSTVADLKKALAVGVTEAPKRGSTIALRELIQPDPSNEIIFTLRPNLDVTFQKVHVRTNSFGMRGGEVSVAKPENTYRIILLGDSFAFGWGVDEEKSFAHLLEEKLSQSLGRPVEVLNFGVPGYSTFQETAQFLAYSEKFNPDAVLVYFVENDWGLPFFLGGSDAHNPIVTAADYARRVWNNQSKEATEERGFYLKIMNPNRALDKLATYTREHGISLFVAVNPGRYWKRDVKQLYVLERAQGITHIPMYEEAKKIITARRILNADLVLPDDPHPSALKHGILAEVLAAGIVKAKK